MLEVEYGDITRVKRKTRRLGKDRSSSSSKSESSSSSSEDELIVDLDGFISNQEEQKKNLLKD
jgi:hypothetical protein